MKTILFSVRAPAVLSESYLIARSIDDKNLFLVEIMHHFIDVIDVKYVFFNLDGSRWRKISFQVMQMTDISGIVQLPSALK